MVIIECGICCFARHLKCTAQRQDKKGPLRSKISNDMKKQHSYLVRKKKHGGLSKEDLQYYIKKEICFALFVVESDFEASHMVPPLYWRFCNFEILLFGDLEISFIFRDPWFYGLHNTKTTFHLFSSQPITRIALK